MSLLGLSRSGKFVIPDVDMECLNIRTLFYLQFSCIVALLLYFSLGKEDQNAIHTGSPTVLTVKKDFVNGKPGGPVPVATQKPPTPAVFTAEQEQAIRALPRISNCSVAEVSRRRKKVLLTSTNTAYLDITLNMLESLNVARVCVKIIIVAEDRKAYEYLKIRAESDHAVQVKMTHLRQMPAVELTPPMVQALIQKREMYVLDLIKRGLEVLSCDSDVFFFRDPFPLLRGKFDAAMLDLRSISSKKSGESLFVDGFVYYKPSAAMSIFVQSLTQSIPSNFYLNQHIRNDIPVKVNVRALDPDIFATTRLYLNKTWRQTHTRVAVLYNLWGKSHRGNVKTLKTLKLWLVSNKVLKTLPR